MENGDIVFGPSGGRPEKTKEAFKPDALDFTFALIAFVLGYLFSRWVFFSWHGWGVFAFTAAYLLTVSAYLIKKGAVITPAAVFWFAITLLTGASFALWSGYGLAGIRPLFLFCSAVYFTLTASGRLMLGSTGNYLLLDGINAVLVIPFRNFINQYLSFKFLHRDKKPSGRKGHIILGVVLALLLTLWLIPMLESADSGGFSKVVGAIRYAFNIWYNLDADIILYLVAAIPMAAYICGLVSGCANRRGTDAFVPENTEKTVSALRILHPATILIALGGLCALYVIFILCQLPYFFSAFTGNRPEGFMVYADYARRGFFELCQIAAINLAVITVGNIISKKHRRDFKWLRILNIALALVTLLLIATALSKMALYIDAYGLSILRLLPCVFMAFLALVFLALIVLQYRQFSIVRLALVTGSVMMCALCLINPDGAVARYNADRYLAGTLDTCDVEIFKRAGPAGVEPAINVLESTDDEALKQEIRDYLVWQYSYDGHETCYETYKVKQLQNAKA